jgi:hypothetical protein
LYFVFLWPIPISCKLWYGKCEISLIKVCIYWRLISRKFHVITFALLHSLGTNFKVVLKPKRMKLRLQFSCNPLFRPLSTVIVSSSTSQNIQPTAPSIRQSTSRAIHRMLQLSSGTTLCRMRSRQNGKRKGKEVAPFLRWCAKRQGLPRADLSRTNVVAVSPFILQQLCINHEAIRRRVCYEGMPTILGSRFTAAC